MAALPMLLTGASMAGSVLGGIGSIQQGRAANAMAKFEARQLEQQAGQVRAAGQRDAEERVREARLAQSRALAVAGASGGSVSDPNVLRVLSGIAAEGQRGFQTEMYNAGTQAENLRAQAVATRASGKAARNAGYIGAASNVLQGAGQAANVYFGAQKQPQMSFNTATAASAGFGTN